VPAWAPADSSTARVSQEITRSGETVREVSRKIPTRGHEGTEAGRRSHEKTSERRRGRVVGVSGYEDGTRPVPTLGISPYSGSNTYAQGDQVTAVGVVYTCLVDAPVGVGPSNPNYWTKAYVPMEQIPTELYEAILTLVPMVFNANQTTTRSQEAVQQYRVLTDHAAMLLQPFIRTRGFSFRPV